MNIASARWKSLDNPRIAYQPEESRVSISMTNDQSMWMCQVGLTREFLYTTEDENLKDRNKIKIFIQGVTHFLYFDRKCNYTIILSF